MHLVQGELANALLLLRLPCQSILTREKPFLRSPIALYVGDMASTRGNTDDEFKSIPLVGLSAWRKMAVQAAKYAELPIGDECFCTRGNGFSPLLISHTGEITSLRSTNCVPCCGLLGKICSILRFQDMLCLSCVDASKPCSNN